ncbi:MAG: phosphotransferase enzyme family protein [Galactobacter sp.]
MSASPHTTAETPFDADVFGADLPGAAALFSPDVLASGVDGAPGPMSVTYLRSKPAVSLTAAVRTSQGLAMAYAVAEGAAAKLEKLVLKAPPATLLHHDPVRRWALMRPEADRDLPGIARVTGARKPTDESSADEPPAFAPLTYKPQRRWVGIRADGAGEEGTGQIVRCYRTAELEAISARWPDATKANLVTDVTGENLRLPTVLTSSRTWGTLTTSRVPGSALAADGGGRIEVMERVGRALAAWHRLPAPPHSTTPGIGMDTGRSLRRLLPDLHQRVDELEARLLALPPAPSQHAVWCHGDFSADQVLVDRRGDISLIDWDRSGAGPRSTDLAVADAAGMDPEAYDALLTGYTQLAPLPSDLTAARALACWSRAVDPFRQADPHWAHHIEERLEHIEELLG